MPLGSLASLAKGLAGGDDHRTAPAEFADRHDTETSIQINRGCRFEDLEGCDLLSDK